MEASFIAVKYGVGIDIGKDNFYACVSAIDHQQRIKIRATHSFKNEPKGMADLYRWVDHHCKDKGLLIHFLMEATGVYYEPLALYLHKQGAYVCVILHQKANHYVKALGIKTAPAARQD